MKRWQLGSTSNTAACFVTNREVSRVIARKQNGFGVATTSLQSSAVKFVCFSAEN